MILDKDLEVLAAFALCYLLQSAEDDAVFESIKSVVMKYNLHDSLENHPLSDVEDSDIAEYLDTAISGIQYKIEEYHALDREY